MGQVDRSGKTKVQTGEGVGTEGVGLLGQRLYLRKKWAGLMRQRLRL